MIAAPEYVFISPARFVGDSQSAFSPNPVAAARTLAATFALNALGYNVRAFSLFRDTPVPPEFASAKALVFADLGRARPAAYRSLIRGTPARVFYDLAEVPVPGTSSHDFSLEAAVLTAGCEQVAERASASVGRPVHAVPEPFQGPREAPRAPRARRRSRALAWLARRAGVDTQTWRLRLHWSGEEAEVDSIVAAYPELLRLGGEVPLSLHCVAPQGPALETLAQALREDDPDALELRLEAWSPFAAAQALASCDLVVLPDNGPASRSRLIAALHAGRLGIARASPYYGSLSEFAWVGEALAEGIRWSLAHTEEVLARLTAGQRYLDQVHEPTAVARTWMQLFMKANR